ncbi:MAG: M20 family metallopeptidase [Oscillospiraceae bacterium]|nr:M20 family metallopeptidase [Oscillospiraceae bacterium]
MKKRLFDTVDSLRAPLCQLADNIYDYPEPGLQEHFAAGRLTGFLQKEGFSVQLGLGSLDTAFRAEWSCGQGGPAIGLLCEYDALEGFGHGCGHHLQPAIAIGAALALKRRLTPETPCRLILYGTPAEETIGGKITLLREGFLQDIDIALITHGGPMTCVDVKSMALTDANVVFTGKSAHSAIQPEEGRSALDALLLAFQGIEFLREHVCEDTRMHYTVAESPGPANVVPARACGSFILRSYNSDYLRKLTARFENIIRGAALMTDTSYEISYGQGMDSTVPVTKLGDLLMENARLAGAANLQPPRLKTGSTDFGNVSYRVPGCCLRIAFVPEGSPSHSQVFLDYGKSSQAHDAICAAAKALAGAVWDLLEQPGALAEIRREFDVAREQMAKA